jgi:hypothetical protein
MAFDGFDDILKPMMLAFIGYVGRAIEIEEESTEQPS